jgi:hypothetical protein
MQETYKKIYEMAESELAGHPYDFGTESVYIHKGFRVSKSIKGEYSWKDARFDDYYEEVDPLITEKVLELGFVKALTLVMIHNDHDKLVQLARRVINIDKEIEYWVTMATEIYNERRGEMAKVNRSKTLSPETKKKRKISLDRKYKRSKALFEKRRRVLKSEKDDVKVDHVFYSNRIKTFKDY